MKKNSLNYITDDVINLIDSLSSVNLNELKKYNKHEFLTGIYFLLKNDEIVYVGKTINLYDRIMVHQKQNVKDFDSYLFLEVDNKKLNLSERYFINKLKPIYNNDPLTKKIKENAI